MHVINAQILWVILQKAVIEQLLIEQLLTDQLFAKVSHGNR